MEMVGSTAIPVRSPEVASTESATDESWLVFSFSPSGEGVLPPAMMHVTAKYECSVCADIAGIRPQVSDLKA